VKITSYNHHRSAPFLRALVVLTATKSTRSKGADAVIGSANSKAGALGLKHQPPQAHFAKRIIPRRKHPRPVRPAINETTPNRKAVIDPNLELLGAALAAPAANSPHTTETRAAPAANSSHTHHSKSLGLKGIFFAEILFFRQ
jgi:hypothetical protein